MTVLSGRVVVVTGSSSGMGRAIADVLTEAGARVHGVSRRAAEAAWTAHRADVTDPDAVRQLLDGIAGREGLDAIVCAAGLNIAERRLDQLDEHSWHDLIETNLSSAFHCVRAALPYLRDRGGDVVLIGSVSGVWPDLSGPAYQAAKAGLQAFARACSLEEHQRGIRFSTIAPGMTDTPMLDRRPVPTDPAVRTLTLRPDDVARVCRFLLEQPRHVQIAEIVILPALIQAPGKTAWGVQPPQDKP